MNNRELLELAAKAVGMPERVVGAKPGYYALYPDTDGVEKFCCMNQWDPLIDDGDCARMETALELCIVWGANYVDVTCSNDYESHAREFSEDHQGHDKNHIRRLASTRCAAEIGRKMT